MEVYLGVAFSFGLNTPNWSLCGQNTLTQHFSVLGFKMANFCYN